MIILTPVAAVQVLSVLTAFPNTVTTGCILPSAGQAKCHTFSLPIPDQDLGS
jgi:hypothetical protein